MLGAGCVCGNEGKVDVGAHHRGKLDLCLFSCFLQSLHCHLVGSEIDARFCLEGFCDPVHDLLVEVVAAESCVTCGCENLENAVFADIEDRNVEGTAAEVIDHNLLVNVLIKTVCKCSRGGLVDYTENLKTCDLACVLGCLTLRVGEVCGNGDNGLVNLGAEICFRIALELLKHHCADFLGSVILAVDTYLEVGTHFTLDRDNCAIGVGDRLSFCYLTDHSFAGLRECNYRGGGSSAFCVGNNCGFACFIYCYAGVGCTEVDTDNFSHN